MANLSQITKPTRPKQQEAEKSIAVLENILRRVVGENKLEPPSFLKEYSSELSIIINGGEKVQPHKTRLVPTIAKNPFPVDFAKKTEPQLIIRGLENTLKTSKNSKEDDYLKKNYKISSNRGNSNNGSTDTGPKSGRFETETVKLVKKISDNKYDLQPKKAQTKKTLSSGSGATELKVTVNLKSRHNENQLLTSSNLLSLVKKTSMSGTKIPLANSIHNGSQASVTSTTYFKSQLMAKLIKNPMDGMPSRELHRNSSIESGQREYGQTTRPSKPSSKKHSKNPSIDKLVLQAQQNLRASDLNAAEQVRSASRHYVKGQGTKLKQRPKESEYQDQSAGTRLKPKTTTRIHHAKNLSEFNITGRNLTKDSLEGRKSQMRGTLGASVISGHPGLQHAQGQVPDEGAADRAHRQARDDRRLPSQGRLQTGVSGLDPQARQAPRAAVLTAADYRPPDSREQDN